MYRPIILIIIVIIKMIMIIIIMKIIMIIIIIIVAMTLKALKVSIFYYYLTYHGNEWACSKEKKRVFYFLTKIKIKAANQCFLIA